MRAKRKQRNVHVIPIYLAAKGNVPSQQVHPANSTQAKSLCLGISGRKKGEEGKGEKRKGGVEGGSENKTFGSFRSRDCVIILLLCVSTSKHACLLQWCK